MMSELDNSDVVVWFICHGVVISQLTKMFTTKSFRKISLLGCLYFKKTNSTIQAIDISQESLPSRSTSANNFSYVSTLPLLFVSASS